MTNDIGEDVANQIRIVIEKAFDSKAESYSNAELAKYFARRELLPTLIHQREHHLIKGRKGTGKTAILLYLSLPVQIYCKENLNADFIGFYMTFGANVAPHINFDVVTDRDCAYLFGHWFNLYACKTITDSISTAIKSGLYNVDSANERTFLSDLWANFLKISENVPSGFKDASDLLDSYQQEIREMLSTLSTREKISISDYLGTKKKYWGTVTNVSDFPQIFNILKKDISSFENTTFLVLVDEYDNLSEAQQIVVNTAIAGSTGKYYFRLGVLSDHGLKSRNTLTELTLRDDQLKFVNIETFIDYREYENFVKSSITARIGEIYNKVSSKPVKNMFADLDKLVPGIDQAELLNKYGFNTTRYEKSQQLYLPDTKENEINNISQNRIAGTMNIDNWCKLLQKGYSPIYCGVDIICLLSSGLIRSAIEITYTILNRAFTENLDIVLHSQCIPYDVQDSAIKHEASYWARNKLLADIKGRTWDRTEPLADVAIRLIGSLLKNFKDTIVQRRHETALNCFSLLEIVDADHDGYRAIREGEITGIFTQLDDHTVSPNAQAVFALHRMCAVRMGLPPICSGCLELSWNKLDEYSRRPRSSKSAKQPELGVPYFLGIGFRDNWENNVRKILQDHSPASYIYHDGKEAHESSILVVRTVEERIDMSYLCVFDITNQNENVCFEYGMALARKKPIRHLFNKAKSTINDPKNLIPLLRGVTFVPYSFSEEPNDEELQSLNIAMQQVANWFNKYRNRKGNPCSIDEKCQFSTVVALPNNVYVSLPEISLAKRCLSDIVDLIQNELQLNIYPINDSGSVTPHYICDPCRAVGRSNYCIIDTTNCDQTQCGILGLAYGYKRQVLNIYQADKPGLITNYCGQRPAPYNDKLQLMNIIKNFLQSSEISPI